MRLRGNEEYCPQEIESKELWSTMIILDPYKKYWGNKKLKKENMVVVRKQDFLGTHG